jgi:hypothetical protein
MDLVGLMVHLMRFVDDKSLSARDGGIGARETIVHLIDER